jgi:hypothetical protein
MKRTVRMRDRPSATPMNEILGSLGFGTRRLYLQEDHPGDRAVR